MPKFVVTVIIHQFAIWSFYFFTLEHRKAAMRFASFIIPLLFIALGFHSCHQVTARMEGYDIHGIDVSHYQKAIDWPSVQEQGVQFAFMKATEGISYMDSTYCDHWEKTKRMGIKRGAYHYFHPRLSALRQAQNFIYSVDLQVGDLPPVIDVEVTNNASREVIVNRLRSWLQIIEFEYKVRPIIYTNLNFYYEYLSEDFKDYPFWIARYSSETPLLTVGQEWKFWQYGQNGRLDGIKGPVDLNVFNGTLEELEAICVKELDYLSMTSD